MLLVRLYRFFFQSLKDAHSHTETFTYRTHGVDAVSTHTHKLTSTGLCYVVPVVVVDPGAPPDGHVSRAWFHSAGSPAAHEEEPGETIRTTSDSN